MRTMQPFVSKGVCAVVAAVALCALLAFAAACTPQGGGGDPKPSPGGDTTEPTPKDVPAATSRVDGAPVFYALAARDDTVTLIGVEQHADEVYFVGEANGVTVHVESQWVRAEDTVQGAEQSATALRETGIFPSPYLIGDELGTISAGQQVTVLEAAGEWAYVTTDDNVTGYAEAAAFDGIPSSEEAAKKMADDIQKKGSVKARIIADDVPLYLAFLDRGESAPLADPDAKDGDFDSSVLVRIGKAEGTVTRPLVRLPSEGTFEEFEGHLLGNGVLYADYMMTMPSAIATHDETVEVVEQYGENYVIVRNGATYYVPMFVVSPESVAEQDALSAPEDIAHFYEPIS